jgi:hypothetical protein
MKAEYFLRGAPVDAVAHQQAHGAGVVIGPDRFRALLLLRAHKRLGNQVECVVPGDGLEIG